MQRQKMPATSTSKPVKAAALSITVAEFLKGFPTGVGKKLVQYLWVPARALGRDQAGRVVVPAQTQGSTSALPAGVSVCLSRGGGGGLKLLAVGGLGAYGLKGTREPQRRPGEIYLGGTPFSLAVKVGMAETDWQPEKLSDAIPGALVCVQERRNAPTPFVNRGQRLVNRNAPLKHDGTGLRVVYCGDIAFVRVDGVWYEYEVAPEHSSLAPIYTPPLPRSNRPGKAARPKRRLARM